MNNKPNHPRLSVIIPCLNEANYLPKLLEDLVKQDIEEPFEVIVADSSSDDDTLGVAKQFTDKLNLKTTSTDRLSAGHTRNAGAKIASSKFLLFTDADGRIQTNFLSTVMATRDQQNGDMLTSKMGVEGWHPFDNIYTAFVNFYFKQTFSSDPRMSGALQFVSASLHRQVGGYVDEMTVGEDVDYSARVAAQAENPVFINQSLVKTSNRRFKTDGRFTMFLRAAEWSGAPALKDSRANNFKFGHYRNLANKIKIHEVFVDSQIRNAFFAACRAFASELVKIIRR